MDPTAAFLIEGIIAAGLARPEEIVGCTEEEIRALEVIHRVKLPRSYRNFLAAMGHGVGRLFNPGEGYGFQFDCVAYLNWEVRFSQQLFRSEDPFPVPETAFFIGTFQSFDYWFIDLAGAPDDPPVWGYGDSWSDDENCPPTICRLLASSVWELVEGELEYRVAIGDRLARMARGLFDDDDPAAQAAKAHDDLRLRGLRQQWEEFQRRCETAQAQPGSDDKPF